MFGEHESESPRVPSPWDPFLPSPPNSVSPNSLPSSALHNGIPKLVPEVEEGNIEYKLKLTHISNARFARLVTQLKWRLLEGGGQAYYELGVADSGALIGLSRADLEESLETLEMMAGEIGASVIVVKEIEVPPTIAALADKDSGYTDPDTGEWTRKMRRRPPLAGGVLSSDSGLSPSLASTTTTDGETDFSTAEFTDIDDFASLDSTPLRTPGIATPSSTSGSGSGYASATSTAIVHRPIRTHPARPTAQSSPFIAPIDDDLALFSMEPEPAFADTDEDADMPASGLIADDELDTGLDPDPISHLGLSNGQSRSSFAGLEIAAVFKPRPVRHRPGAVPLGPTPGRHGKRFNKAKEKRAHPWHQLTGTKGGKDAQEGQLSKEEKAAARREARDKKREEKRNALIALAQGDTAAQVCSPPVTATASSAASPSAAPLHLKDVSLPSSERASALVAEVDEAANILAHGVDELHAAISPETSPVVQVRQLADEIVQDVESGEREPRLIVEALVVRKMSIEEATLDFSRLALI